MPAKHPNEKARIVVLPGAARATYGARESSQIRQAVSDYLLGSVETYRRVNVTVKHRPDGSPQRLHLTLLRAYTYTADLVSLNVDASYNVRSVDTSPELTRQDYGERPLPAVPDVRAAIPPKPRVDMVFGTPVSDIPTAKLGVETAYKIATAAGFKAVKLLGRAANLANYTTYLSGHLKAFGSIGHGYTGGIVLDDGNLTSTWFAALPKDGLSPEVIYFNSCQVFNPPLQPAIMGAGARTFSGGKVNLLIGPSEEVFKCFWTRVLKNHLKMGPALSACERANYPTPGAHGISGKLGVF